MDSSEWGNKHDEMKTPPLLKFLPVLLVKLACSLLQQSVFEHLAPILSLISPTTTNYKDRLKKPKPKYVGPAFASIAWTLKLINKKDIRPNPLCYAKRRDQMQSTRRFSSTAKQLNEANYGVGMWRLERGDWSKLQQFGWHFKSASMPSCWPGIQLNRIYAGALESVTCGMFGRIHCTIPATDCSAWSSKKFRWWFVDCCNYHGDWRWQILMFGEASYAMIIIVIIIIVISIITITIIITIVVVVVITVIIRFS